MKLLVMFKSGVIAISLVLITGCAASIRTVPFTVQSDPLGAYVMFQVQADLKDQRSYDWIFLGFTPLDTRRSVLNDDLKNADAFIIRVLKEGYLEQQKSWTGQQMVTEARTKGAVFWSPKLVPAE